MKTEEFKRRLIKKLYELIDVYYGEGTVIDNIANSTLKVMVDANSDKIGEALINISKNGEVNAETIISTYSSNIPKGGMNIDIKEFIKSDFLNGFLPNKSLNITKEDIEAILDETF